MQRKTQGWNKQMFCFVALCILYVLNLLLNGSDNIKPFSVLSYVYIYLFMLCDFLFFFMKVPFNMSCSALRKYSIPHSLLLYSVHVKWILICVQNVDKDENTLDYILCTHLCCVLLLVESQRKCNLFAFSLLAVYYRTCTLNIILFLGQLNSEWTDTN